MHYDPGMKGKLSLHLLFQGIFLYETLAWEVKMPTEIHGLKGSCLVIPCSFHYTSYPPNDPNRVVWYQWVSKGYPLVYDSLYPDSVIDKFRGKTDLYRDSQSSDKQCSLVIKSLDPSHDGEKLYAWIDPKNIGWRTYKFYDITSTIHVDANPKQPVIKISGSLETGNSIAVECYTFHTCPYNKPSIILKGLEGSDKTDHVHVEDGLWKITLTRTGVVKAERLDIECTVSHFGGITANAKQSQIVRCFHYNITIEPKLAYFTEGVTKDFTCTVYHSCQRDPPTISWNYEKMQISNRNEKLTGFDSATFSTITFVGAKEDHGKTLKCTAKVSGKNIENFVILHMHRSLTELPKPVNPVQNASVLQSNVMTFDLKTTGIYILIPSSFVLLLICTLAGVITYKRCHRASLDNMQQTQLQQRSKDRDKAFAKPYMPSPSGQRHPCAIEDLENFYTNMDELNEYGNI